MNKKCAFVAFLVLFAGFNNLSLADDVLYIAGLNPTERPAEAPVTVTFDKSSDWYKKALAGISQPYPASLHFLESQGPWYSPFIHPGMTGYYDIRNLHRK